MNKNIDKSLVKEGLKEDTSYLNLEGFDGEAARKRTKTQLSSR
jgi:hypothetical protein